MPLAHGRLRWISLTAAVLLLDASLTFQNIWPTPAVRWRGDLSIELAAVVLVLATAWRRFGPPSRAVIRGLAAVWTLLAIGRYADVTAPALYGREVNLYWDLRHVSGVAAMFATAASRWLVLLVVVAAVVVVAALYRALAWAIGRVGAAVVEARERRALVVLAVAVAGFFAADRMGLEVGVGVPAPVVQAYARQARLAVEARAAVRDPARLVTSPPMNSDLSLIEGADVLLVFVESYGAVSYEKPEFAAGLATSRAGLEAAVRDTHRAVVSAYVDSPTFGGSSWLAHISLITGVEVTDAGTNALLMNSTRETLVKTFGRHGYRTAAIMPGMWQSWPEGAFYGFDEIYGGERLAYRGPSFGWWDIPDQYALARMDALELAPSSRRPVFIFFPTISTHAPFSPVPPYQPDWGRILTKRPFDAADLDRAFANPPDWIDLGPSYVNSVVYANVSLAGYLREHGDRDFVMVVLGDHQPPAAVSGEGASHAVPVHVIASRQAVLDRLRARGFGQGLTPSRPAIGRMHELLPTLLDAFGNREPAE